MAEGIPYVWRLNPAEEQSVAVTDKYVDLQTFIKNKVTRAEQRYYKDEIGLNAKLLLGESYSKNLRVCRIAIAEYGLCSF